MTTTGEPVLPSEDRAYHRLLDLYTEQAEALLAAGVDLIIIETLMGLTEGMAAFVPIYKLLDRLPAVRNLSNRIVVLEKA